MSRAESQPVEPEEYGPLVMEIFQGIEYESLDSPLPRGFLTEGLRLIDAKKRSKSSTEPGERVTWTLNDYLSEYELFGVHHIGRLLVLQKETEVRELNIRLWRSMQKVSVIRTSFDLPPDFNPHNEFMNGLKALTGQSDEE